MILPTTADRFAPHHLIIPESDNPQPHLSQRLLPPLIFLFLQIVDVAIHFNDQSDVVEDPV